MFFFYSHIADKWNFELCDASTCSASPTTAAQSLVSNTLILVRVVRILKLHQWLCRQLQALLLAVTTASFTRSSVSPNATPIVNLRLRKTSPSSINGSCRLFATWFHLVAAE
ncbi:hypothetical protein Bca52824_045375 [Brassica carinata]|uniref:Uncharacterized protein n=1 Tax=Brassica carinata TaxID=52824 RepID=A0A8X7URH1_BRACI|nr:hypothetical protein Bca52824_045375 [Brassica carinata]